jgi:hypothetical protein
MPELNPFLLRNRDEILSRKEAAEKLKLHRKEKTCFLYCNGEPGEHKEIRDMFDYIGEEGYHTVYSTNYGGGIFPVVDYFNAANRVVFGGGYNSFWETKYFQKDAVYVPAEIIFENQEYRIQHNREFTFEENGDDQLVDIIMKM